MHDVYYVYTFVWPWLLLLMGFAIWRFGRPGPIRSLAAPFMVGLAALGLLLNGINIYREVTEPPRCQGGASSIGPVSIKNGKVVKSPKPHVTYLPKGCKP